MRQNAGLTLHDGGKNEVVIRCASRALSRWMRVGRQFRSRKTDQGCGTNRADLAIDKAGPA